MRTSISYYTIYVFSRNQLSYLPDSICQLPSLKVLVLNNNRLVSLPEEVGKMQSLTELDASCNEITHLPVQIGDMTTLRSLNLRRNHLQEVPVGEYCIARDTEKSNGKRAKYTNRFYTTNGV